MAWKWAGFALLDQWLDTEPDPLRRQQVIEAMARIMETAPDAPGRQVGPHPLRRRVTVEDARVEIDFLWSEQFHALNLLGIYDHEA